MGTWGPGNFDNDPARDHLFELTRSLAEQIEQALELAAMSKLYGHDAGREPMQALDPVLPNIEIICLLHESLGGGFLPEPETAADWQARFEQLHPVSSTERQAVIDTTFARLLRLAQECWED